MYQNLKEKQKAVVNVIRTDADSHQFIVTYGEDKKVYRLPMLQYQRHSAPPKTLQCIVEESFNGGIHLRQDYEALIRSIYKEGDIADFTVIRSYTDFYILQEKHGFTIRLDKKLIPNPALTPIVRCRVESINGRYMQAVPVENLKSKENNFPINDSQLDNLIGNAKWNSKELRQLILGNTNSELFDTVCHIWIASKAKDYSNEALLQSDMLDTRNRLLDVLESSPMLNTCDPTSRQVLEERFTDIIEQTDFYLQALTLVRDGKADSFVDRVLNKLDQSNYVYHPRQQFYIMMYIFLQDYELIEHRIKSIIRIISRDHLTLSKRPPFGKLWITMLEYYIQQNYYSTDSLSRRDTVENMIQALALQLNLAEEYQNNLFDVVLNRSLLYRLCSKMGVANPQALLEESLYNLVSDSGDQAVYLVNNDDATLTANIIANQVADTIDASLAPVTYQTDNARLLIKDGKVSISALDVTRDNVYTPLPTRLNLWHAFSIRLSEKPAADLRDNKLTTLPQYKLMWNFVYNSLFVNRHSQRRREKRKLLPGEDVSIVMRAKLSPDDDSKLVFKCEVIDEGYEGIMGYIDAANDIVPYFPGKKLSLDDFMHNGRPLILPAVVEGQEDGAYHFVMNETVEDFMEDYRIEHLNFNSSMKCVLNNNKPGATRVPAISTNGLCVSVGVEPGTDLSVLAKGKVVEVYKPTQGPKPYINATYRSDIPDMFFSVGAAFHQLMVNLANGEVLIEDNNTDSEPEMISALDPKRIEELMNIFEAYAGFEDDYIKAYNYISICRVLAKMLKSKREDYYCKRLSLIELLNDFALNNSFTHENQLLLNGTDDSGFEANTQLYREFQQMKVVSWLNTDEHYDELYKMSCMRNEPTLQMLAALVMSHNTVKKAGLISQADEILDKIRSILKLRKNTSDKKDYGREDYHTEFKTSIVYPENSMQANVTQQTQKILQEICAFLNADGGTLYLGVNNQGTESGVEEDLKHPWFNGSTDHYEDYLNDQVAKQLSQEAAHFVHTHWDEGTKRNVLVVDIEPSPDPIALCGEYYERMGKSARKVKDDYRPVFLSSRRKWAAEHKIESNNISSPQQTPANILPTPMPSNTQNSIGSLDMETPLRTDKIQTNRKRNNVIHDYEENYLPVTAYLCFIDNDGYKLIEHDDYQTDNYRLELAIHEEEESSWLVLVYEDGKVVKTSIEELLHRDKDRVFKRYAGKELIYAGIANDNDEIVIGFVDGKGNKRLRFDDISKIEEDNMQAYGETVCDVTFDHIHYVEIVRKAEVPDWVQMNPPRKELGIVLKTVNGRKLAKWLPDCSID